MHGRRPPITIPFYNSHECPSAKRIQPEEWIAIFIGPSHGLIRVQPFYAAPIGGSSKPSKATRIKIRTAVRYVSKSRPFA